MYDKKKKIPNPLVFGNVGSFFKNPIVSKQCVKCLLNKYPDMPIYFHKTDLIKLSAKWLIDCCRLQGCRFGNAAVHREQSLVLININQKATPDEIVKLALHVQSEVVKRFHIYLEPEVQFISNFGKIDGIKLLFT